MGMILRSISEGPPWPCDIECVMTCDGKHGFLEPEPQVFPDFLVVYKAGWKETFDNKGRKLWLGPCCSKKLSK